jgi:cysteine-rich repeat protein
MPLPFATRTDQASCCHIAQACGSCPFSWCSDSAIDSSTGLCTHCVHPCEVCGNGIKEGSEQCDDGNTVGDDGCSPTCTVEWFFRDDFGGEQLDPARWRVSLNAYPAPGISVSNGFLLVGQAGVTALDFPYVESVASLFPAAGAFRLEVVMQFTSAGTNGSGLSVLGANDRSLVRIWNQTVEPSGLTVTLPGGRLTLNHFAPEDPHTFSMTFSGGVLNISVDGTPVVGNFPVDSQPSRIWLGHPTVGQFFGIDQTDDRPAGINDTGMVVERWWTTATWSSFRLDSITVLPLPGQGG